MLQTCLFGGGEIIGAGPTLYRQDSLLSVAETIGAARSHAAQASLDKIKGRLTDTLRRRGALKLDDLAILSGFPPGDIGPALTELRLSGAVALNSSEKFFLL